MEVLEKVLLDVVRRRIVIRGDDADVRAIRDAVAQQVTGQSPAASGLEESPLGISNDACCPDSGLLL